MKNMAGLLTEHDKHVLNRVQTSISMELFWSVFLLVLIWRSFIWHDDGYNNEPLFNFHHKTEPLWMIAMSFEGLSWNILGWNKFVFLERSRCNHSHSWGLSFEFYHTLYLFIFSWFQKQISSEDNSFFLNWLNWLKNVRFSAKILVHPIRVKDPKCAENENFYVFHSFVVPLFMVETRMKVLMILQYQWQTLFMATFYILS